MIHSHYFSRFLPIVGLAALAMSAPAQAATRIGGLECNVSGGIGFVITSSKALSCVFRSSGGHYVERYYGTVRRFGLDFGFTGPGQLAWAVFAPSRPGPGALAGDYAGGSAGVTVGVGVGANALVGGFNNSFTLQPLSVQVQTGANVAAGVGAMRLDYSGPAPYVVHHYHHHHHHWR